MAKVKACIERVRFDCYYCGVLVCREHIELSAFWVEAGYVDGSSYEVVCKSCKDILEPEFIELNRNKPKWCLSDKVETLL